MSKGMEVQDKGMKVWDKRMEVQDKRTGVQMPELLMTGIDLEDGEMQQSTTKTIPWEGGVELKEWTPEGR